MIISNNIAAQTILNESNRNLKKSSKLAEKLSTGTKITSAGDDAAGYTISERMRVKLRALNQDDNNVKSGKDMLTVASGAVQSQMNILRTIKERVIDANNDTNTDTDRKIIQREIDEYYDQMSIIAYDTDFNGEKLLVGGKVDQVVESWEVYDHAVMAEDSEIPGLLTDAIEGDLDGEPGPFATFGKENEKVKYDGYKQEVDDPNNWTEKAASDTNGANFVGGTKGKSNEIEIDLSSYNIAALDNTRFYIGSVGSIYSYFTLTTDTSRNYRGVGHKIDISGCTTTDEVVARIKTAVESVQSIVNSYDIAVNGSKINFTTKADGKTTNNSPYSIVGQETRGGDETVDGHAAAANTGLSLGKFSGGADAETKTYWVDTTLPGSDLTTGYNKTDIIVPAKNAIYTIKGINNVVSGSGITINGSTTNYLVFVDGNSGITHDNTNNYYTIGKNFSGKFNLSGIEFNMSGGAIIATANSAGRTGNNFSFTDGISFVPDVTTHYTATQKLDGITNKQSGEDGDRAHWDMDLSAYDTTDAAKTEELIKKYLGKTIGANSANIEFIDSGSSSGMDALYKITKNTIDLNDVRTAVAGGTTAAQAFGELLAGKSSNIKTIAAADGTITGVKFLASQVGEKGNSEKMVSQTGELRHYTIDWQNWVNTQNITDIPAALHEKGIRFYCPTDGSQWVNVRFVNGLNANDADRPASGTDKLDIKTLTIDVAGITDTKSLVEKIDKELGDYLVNTYNHNLLLTSDPASGTTTIYDERRHTVMNNSGYKQRQTKGAKIGTGLMDNVAKSTRNVLVNEVIIQHTDKANMNIHLKIPQTSLDHIFGYKTSMRDISEYNVMTSDMREKLLGVPPKKGILDRGIQYLADAQTLIGAQVNHLEVAKNNIDTQNENLTASESVIRDADMAATMVEFTKYNILGQAAQSMLAQANQLPQRILELLQ